MVAAAVAAAVVAVVAAAVTVVVVVVAVAVVGAVRHNGAMRVSGGVGGVVSCVLMLVACSGASTTEVPATSSGALHACSPLDAKAEPISLAHVLGAGRHADGTLYVLDDGSPSYRAFVSAGNVLQRKEVSGSGTVGGASGATTITATVRDGAAPFALHIEQSAGVATRMGVFRGELQAKSFEIGAQGDVLAVVQPDALAQLEVRNLPGTVVPEHDATTQDGHRIFVTRPEVDWGYEDFRVFYGTPERMAERRLVTASRGSTTFIAFDLDGAEVTAIFPSRFSPVGDTARLASKQESQPMTVLEAGSAGDGLSFFCF